MGDRHQHRYQHSEEFGAINPNRKILPWSQRPGRQSHHAVLSPAPFWYLAEKTGRLLPTDPLRVSHHPVVVLADIQPRAAPAGGSLRQPCRESWHRCPIRSRALPQEAGRLYGVLEGRLVGHHRHSFRLPTSQPSLGAARRPGRHPDDFPNVKRWCDAIAQRPSARKKVERDEATKQAAKSDYYTDETWNVLFGGQKPQSALRGLTGSAPSHESQP